METGPEFRDLFCVKKELGEGTFAKTYLATVRSTGEEVVVKRFCILGKYELRGFNLEVEIHRAMAEDGIAPRIHASWVYHVPLLDSKGNLRQGKINELTDIGMIVMERMDGTFTEFMNERWLSDGKQAPISFAQEMEQELQTHVLPLIHRANRTHFVTHADCGCDNIMFKRVGNDRIYYLIDWGYAQAFFPNGPPKHERMRSMRWHNRQILDYDLGLLEWDFNCRMASMKIHHSVSFTTPEIMAFLVENYARLPRNSIPGDAWPGYEPDHPLVKRILHHPAVLKAKKRQAGVQQQPQGLTSAEHRKKVKWF